MDLQLVEQDHAPMAYASGSIRVALLDARSAEVTMGLLPATIKEGQRFLIMLGRSGSTEYFPSQPVASIPGALLEALLL